MNAQTSRFKLPPRTHTHDHRPRRVGFELEFTGLYLDQTLEVLQTTLGGRAKPISAAERELQVPELGTFIIELDWDYLKRLAAQSRQANEEEEWLELLSQAASLLVPVEVVCPPLPFKQLDALEDMVEGLRQAGAVGTDRSPIAAYGVHVNAEIPQIDAPTLHAYLQAFALLQWWLVEKLLVDVTRRISPYIDLYPEAYLKRLLTLVRPSLKQLFDGYLDYNETRNRALDLMPLLDHIDHRRLHQRVDDPKIKPRPAFHYRMPNCHVERPDWSLADAWNSWWVVEKLAEDPEALETLGKHFLSLERPVLGVSRSDWVEFMQQWLDDHGLA